MSPLQDLPDADAISAAVLTCPSVAGLSGGLAGEVATYLPGRRVAGVRTEPGSAEVHVIARYGPPLADIAAEVRRAVAAVVPGLSTVNVVVADVQDPFAPEPEPALPVLPPAGAVPTVTTDATAPALPAAPAP
jgi:uncharacterized alkaline shock family protein YloU